MFAHISHDTALALPWDTVAPLSRQTQAEPLRVAPLGRWHPTGGQVGVEMAQGKSVHDDVPCHQEGFESEFYGYVSFGERAERAVESR
jgi:hypothetical protein